MIFFLAMYMHYVDFHPKITSVRLVNNFLNQNLSIVSLQSGIIFYVIFAESEGPTECIMACLSSKGQVTSRWLSVMFHVF